MEIRTRAQAGNTQMRTRSEGKTMSDDPEKSVSVEAIKGCNIGYSRFPREISVQIRNVRVKDRSQKAKSKRDTMSLVPH